PLAVPRPPLLPYTTLFRSYGSPIRQTEPERLVVGPSLQYTGERFSARAEYFFAYEANYHRAHTAYLEAAYFLTPHFQVGGRAEIDRKKHTSELQSRGHLVC